MSEEAKTVTFLAAAMVTGLAAFMVSREAPDRTAADDIGSAFVAIDDPLAVQRLKVVKYDKEKGESQPFEVAKVDGLYSIPSHDNYPADAQDHLAEAVTFVNNVEILDALDDTPSAHKDYGVVDPQGASASSEDTGVGTRVTMSSEDGTTMADIIIGEEVKDATGQRYVRHADKNQVYTVKIDPGKISTKFEDWIERDLLKLEPSEISKVAMNDYTAVVERRLVIGPGGPQMAFATDLDMKSSIDLAYDQKDLKWKLDQLTTFAENQPQEQKLSEDEELNNSTLNDLKFALDDLEIVDVRRKTEGLRDDVVAAIKKNPGLYEDLERRGYFLQEAEGPSGKSQFILLSNNGEINIGLKTGVEYVLRFGNVAGADTSDEQDSKEKDSSNNGQDQSEDSNEQKTHDHDEHGGDEQAKDGDGPQNDDADEQKSDSNKVLRFLLVTAQLNSDLIAKPDLKDVPPEEPPADATANEEGETEGETSEDASAVDESTKDDGAATDDENNAVENSGDENKDADEADGKTDASEQESTSDGEAAAAAGANSAEDEAKKLEEWKDKRKDIIEENERVQKEYDQKIKDAGQRVEELNERFASWFYVINDETYRKIHLGRDDIVKKKDKSEDADKKDGGSTGAEDTPKSDLEKFNEIKESVDVPGGENE